MSKQNTEKEFMFERVKTLYGDMLDKEQLAAIESGLDQMISVFDKIRSVPLENSDEPFSVFKPYKKDRK
jgi:hypothetical protein